jgi:ATP-dependent RNA helicase DeaD
MRERQNLQKVERMVKRPFRSMPIPTGSEICGKQLFNWVNKLETVKTNHQEIEKFLPEIKEKLASLDREELLKRVVSLEFDRFLDDYRHGEDLIDPVPEKESRRSREGGRESGLRGEAGFKRLFINLGKSDGFYPEQLIGLIKSNTKNRRIPIGKIDLMSSFSFFEVEATYADELMNTLNNTKYMGRKVVLEPAQEKTDRPENRDYSRRKPTDRAGRSDRKPEKRRGREEKRKNKYRNK